MGANAEFLKLIGPELRLLLPELDEKGRRLTLGAVARAAGDGGTGAVAKMTGASWQTVADGAAELGSGELAPEGRVRRPGGGRKKLAEADPGLAPALLALVEDSARGDPQSPLAWTTKSVKNLAGELTAQGHRCSPQTVWRLLHEQGFSTQSNARVKEGGRHPDRDAQFRHIAGQAREFLAAGDPVISVDAKKKEQVGEYARAGREWRRAGDPVKVRSHDFPDKDGGHAIPYGIYDGGANTGWKNRAWKTGLAELARETGLENTVCHFPPGTSKWNKIEHRLFSQITCNWRGRPLTSHETVVNTIAAVTTSTGLTVTAVLDASPYPTGTEVSDEQMQELEDRALTRHHFHGEWNYALSPRPAPPPRPEPPPAPPGPDLHALADPAITGMPRAAFGDLAASLELPYAAAREQRLHLARGGPRHGRPKGPAAPVKLSLPAYLLAALCRYRLGMTCQAIADLLAVDHSTISVTTRHIADLLTQHGAAITPGPHRIRTLQDLRRHATRHGITITGPSAADTPPDDTLTTPDTPATHLTLERLHGRCNDPRR